MRLWGGVFFFIFLFFILFPGFESRLIRAPKNPPKRKRTKATGKKIRKPLVVLLATLILFQRHHHCGIKRIIWKVYRVGECLGISIN